MPKAINLLLGLTLKRTDHYTKLFHVLNQHINHSRSFVSHTMFCKGLSVARLNPHWIDKSYGLTKRNGICHQLIQSFTQFSMFYC